VCRLLLRWHIGVDGDGEVGGGGGWIIWTLRAGVFLEAFWR
jgi:hypothetical protein